MDLKIELIRIDQIISSKYYIYLNKQLIVTAGKVAGMDNQVV